MITSLRIQNFKCWQDTGLLKLKPLTIFFGTNSSGKSSIGQFLMMLKQTAESSDRKAVFYPGGKNSAVQLGSYQEMVYRRDPKNKIKFEYHWVLPAVLEFKDPVSEKVFCGDALRFNAEVGFDEKNAHALALDHLKYQLIEGEKSTLTIGMERNAGMNSDYKVEATDYSLKRKQGRVWYPGAPVRFYGFPDEVVAYHQNAGFVQSLNLSHEKLFHSISYLGPLRTKTERLYSWTGNEPESVGITGENTIAALLAARNRKIGIVKPGKINASQAKPFQEIIALKLKEMGLIDGFKVCPISEQRQEYEVKVLTKGSRDWVDLPDIGFGISQVLPVLVQCFYAPAGSIILMEQPEIHLHPNAQSALADVMIDVINAKENGTDRNIQLIIETHSEHFLRRLQRRIAENGISKDKVSAHFANIVKTPAKLEPLQIDTFGNILNWPENFFGDEMGDITKQAQAAMKKRARQAASKSGEGCE